MTYVILHENELIVKSSAHVLNEKDVEVLIEHEETIKKFLLKTKVAYQMELTKGTFRGSEEKLYRSMDTMDESIKSLHSVSTAVKEYTKELQEKENLKNKKK